MQDTRVVPLQSPDLQQLLALADHPDSDFNLRTYFGDAQPAGTPPRYTGSRFEFLAGGGYRSETANRITADDLVAVQMLSVHVPGDVLLSLLEGDLGRHVAAELSQIGIDVGIGDPRAVSLLTDGGHAAAAWHMLEEPHGMGWVISSKLLARKMTIRRRPRMNSCATCGTPTSARR